MSIQIDALTIIKSSHGQAVLCNLYTGDRCIKITMGFTDYESLKRDGFFVRPTDEADSAGCINTTRDYALIPLGGVESAEPSRQFTDGLE